MKLEKSGIRGENEICILHYPDKILLLHRKIHHRQMLSFSREKRF